MNDLSGDPRRFIGRQQHGQGCDIRDTAEPAERCFGSQNSASAIVKRPRCDITFGLGVARREGIDTDLMRREFER
jgi:hypothetical protein